MLPVYYSSEGSRKDATPMHQKKLILSTQYQAATGSLPIMEGILEVLLNDSDMNLMAEAVEHIMQRQASDSEKVEFLQRSLALGVHLQDVANRLTREHASRHNVSVWPFTHDLSVKIFSGLGTQSLCHAAATCTMFNKLAMEAGCYANIDLTTGGSTVTDETVAKIMHRAGHCLRTLKLGVVLHHSRLQGLKLNSSPLKIPVWTDKALSVRCATHDWTTCPLSKTCLHPLLVDGGVAGSMLKALHLSNIEGLDSKYLCKALMACPSLMDLKVVSLNVSLRTLMDCLGSHCHNVESLCCQQPRLGSWPGRGAENIKLTACNTLVKGCPRITSLTLSACKLADRKAAVLVRGLLHLIYVDFSGVDHLSGVFLGDMVGRQEIRLETLILRDCVRLKQVAVERFLFALSTGECKNLRYLDISNRNGLAETDWSNRRVSPSFEGISRVHSVRPNLCLVADYPDHKSGSDSDSMSIEYSDDSDNIQLSLDSESLSENSYSLSSGSDRGGHQDDDDYESMSQDELVDGGEVN